MKWFKHYTDNHRGRSIQDLLDTLGHTGLCYYLLVEMCAEKLEKDENGLTEADCLFSFHSRIVRQNLRISAVNLRKLLDICAANGLLSFEFSGNSLQIKMPILLNLLERNTKKAHRARIDLARKTHLDKERDKEEDKERDKELYSKVEKPDKTENLRIWQTYLDAYRLRYGIEPVRNAQVNSQISNLRKKLGADDACSVVMFYLKHNDAWYLKNTHSFGLCLKDAETLRTQMLRGRAVTMAEARKGESEIKIQQNLIDAQKGGF